MRNVETGMSGCQLWNPATRNVEIEAFCVHSAAEMSKPVSLKGFAMEMMGFEPTTSDLRSLRSPN